MDQVQQAIVTESQKQIVDVASFATVAATLFELLPHGTALLSFIWVCIRLYETETVKKWLKKQKPKKQP